MDDPPTAIRPHLQVNPAGRHLPDKVDVPTLSFCPLVQVKQSPGTLPAQVDKTQVDKTIRPPHQALPIYKRTPPGFAKQVLWRAQRDVTCVQAQGAPASQVGTSATYSLSPAVIWVAESSPSEAAAASGQTQPVKAGWS